MIKVEHVKKVFMDDAGPIEVLKDVCFTIDKGEMVSLIGISGAGKTTLLQSLGGIDTITSGTIEIEGKILQRMSPRELARFRSKTVGFVFQFHHLLPDFTALENALIPGMLAGKPRKECVGRAGELLEMVGLSRRFNHYPSELSGGERQRVALARALFNAPALILADEPTGNLDKENGERLLDVFCRANRELNQTFLVATHNDRLSQGMHRTIFIEDGMIVSRGPVA